MVHHVGEEHTTPMDDTAGPRPGSELQPSEKRHAILQACEQCDVNRLVQLTDSPGGLLDDELRRLAWPILLGCSRTPAPDEDAAQSWRTLPKHRDEEQVQLDVDRAFVYYPNSDSQEKVAINKSKLFDLIVKVLRTHRALCYFQGYHDIVQVLLLVLGDADAFPAVATLSLCRIRDYMLPSLTPAVKHLRLIPAILQMADAPLAQHLSQTEPFFALSATLTLYAHDIQEYSDIARLYDFILAHEPVIAIYLFASIILRRRSELLEIPIEEPEMIHFTLSKLPQPLDLETLISRTLELSRQYPPEKLPRRVWQRISSFSVLKTARVVDGQHNLVKAEELFEKQRRQLYRDELVAKGLLYMLHNKRSIASVSMALFVAGVGIWLRRTGHDRTILSAAWQMFDYLSKR